MMLTLSHPTSILKGSIGLPSSKSESNRILILQALSGGRISYENISEAHDTVLLREALGSDQKLVDIHDAGTAMRFLTAHYCAAGRHKILTGSDRMQERPIGILVNALRDLGFRIEYLKNEGFPPLEIFPVDLSRLHPEVAIAGHISSQYISALMMIGPVLEKGLDITFTTPLSSKPYIDLTYAIMHKVGLECTMTDRGIKIPCQSFGNVKFKIGADWSAASYWFSMAALAQEAELYIPKLSLDSYQGDKQIAAWCKKMGVQNYESPEGLSLFANNFANQKNPINPGLHFDFTHHPDLAQTVIVLCAASRIKAIFAGLESLRIKETDRILALQNELLKFGVKLVETSEGTFELQGTFTMSHQVVHTYGDHRMAMAFAPLALLGKITIDDPEVVRKSYPGFWEEMRKAGFEIS